MTALRLTHTFFSLLLKYYSSEKRFQLSWCHAWKLTLHEGLSSALLLHFFPSGLPVVLTPPSTRQVADARNTNSSKVPKRSVGLYKWSMAFPSVLPVNIERICIIINCFWIRIKFAIVYVHDTCFFFLHRALLLILCMFFTSENFHCEKFCLPFFQ